METDQIYTLVNDVGKQTMGETAITVVDGTTLVTLGKSVLSSTTNVENFANTLIQKVGRSIISFRDYQSQLRELVVDSFTFGAIVQKIKVAMPVAESDPSFNLVNGESIDMFKVSKPVVKQKLFVKRTPYQFYVTIQDTTLKEAFLTVEAMGAFIASIYGEVRNKIELTLENNGRICMGNFICQTGASQRINLVANYNALTASTLTASTAVFDGDFLRYAIGQINLYGKKMRSMSKLYNKEGEVRHTPSEQQCYACLDEFTTQLETVVQYSAFNEKFVQKVANIEIPYWQNAQTPDQLKIKVEGAEVPAEVSMDNVVAMIFDREALGMYKKNSSVYTTPFNASGCYTNTYWHEEQMWFNDLSENGLVFTLN